MDAASEAGFQHRYRDLWALQQAVKIIACIEDPAVIEKILAHLNGKAASSGTALLPENRALPHARLFD